MKWWWCGVMMRWLAFFYILFTKGIFRELERNTHDFFALLCFEIFALPLFFLYGYYICISFFGKWDKPRKSFGRLENFWQKILALSENLGGCEKLLRQTFALEKLLRQTFALGKLLRQTFALEKMFVPNLCAWKIVCAKPLRLKNCLRQTFALEKLLRQTFAPDQT
jgi:hypothetical protein